jgi:hypothetical protein
MSTAHTGAALRVPDDRERTPKMPTLEDLIQRRAALRVALENAEENVRATEQAVKQFEELARRALMKKMFIEDLLRFIDATLNDTPETK